MTFRYMYDATNDNVRSLLPLNPKIIARYRTGTSSVVWTAADSALFPDAQFVDIDQGGPGSPVFHSTVVDVESFAWTVENAENIFLPKCTASRPTIYCSRNTLLSVTVKCDIWVAAPGLTDTQAIALAGTDDRIVAVQNLFAATHDRSIIIDPFWPEVKPVTTPTPTPKPAPVPSISIQGNWEYCPKCGALVHTPEASDLPCAGGGKHEPHSHEYFLPFL